MGAGDEKTKFGHKPFISYHGAGHNAPRQRVPSASRRRSKGVSAHQASRRTSLAFLIGTASFLGYQNEASMLSWAASDTDLGTIAMKEEAAFQAYADRDFDRTVRLLTDLLDLDPGTALRWLEMRAQVFVDGKDFASAMKDYDSALSLSQEPGVRARLHAGRALALEGVSDWRAALVEYDRALECARDAGFTPDPYIINSRGNIFNSLGNWAEARENYLISSDLFQQARGFRGKNGNTTDRVDGAIFSASNAALMLAQMGEEEGAIKEMERLARRGPGSVDMRAALAALYYDRGLRERAEDQWEFACDKIVVGCKNYRDRDWLQSVRRWPPVMVQKMMNFVQLRPPPSAGPFYSEPRSGS